MSSAVSTADTATAFDTLSIGEVAQSIVFIHGQSAAGRHASTTAQAVCRVH
jgi:hypothetical protein